MPKSNYKEVISILKKHLTERKPISPIKFIEKTKKKD